MAESKHPDWAYVASDTDDPEIKIAAEKSENIDISKVEITGKFTTYEPCKFLMDLDANICRILDNTITKLRSCSLKAVKIENGQTANAVQISTKIGSDYIWFLILFDNNDDAMKVLNICRKYFHLKGGFIDYLSPRWTGTLDIEVTALQDQASNGNDGIQNYTIILDEEAMFLFRDFNKRLPDFYLHFYKESTDHSIERALVQHYTNSVVLESLRSKFVIQNADDHVTFTEVMKTIKPKPKDIFEDHSKTVKYVTDLAATGRLDTDVKSSTQRNAGTSRRTDDYYRDQSNSAGNQATIIARELDQAMEALSVNEELSIPWIVAETEITEMIENPEAFGDSQKDMLSGGLDPNNPDHLMRSFSEIKEHLISQRYDMALSRLNGTKVVFQESEIPEIKSLIETNAIELLKKLYFHSFFEG